MSIKRLVTICPSCNSPIEVVKLQCTKCGLTMEGKFSECPFCSLPTEDFQFMISFLLNEGQITEIEKELNISYPTVKKRLEFLLDKLRPMLQKFQKESKV